MAYENFIRRTAEKVMKSINVEITIGHNIGITVSYYKPKEIEVLDDYLKAVELLTFSQDNAMLDKKVKELQEQNKNTDYIIKGKLQEKDTEIKDMKSDPSVMKQQILSLLNAVGSINSEEEKQSIARHSINNGVYTVKD